MASLLDVGILNYFVPAFVFLLIYGVILALLEKTNIFGTNHAINQLIAVCMGILFILTPDLVGIVKIITPWFTVLFIFILMLILVFLFVGVKSESVASAFEDRSVIWVIIIISIAILLFAVTQVYGEQIHGLYPGDGNITSGEEGLNQVVGRVIFHPRVLGMIFLLIIVAQAIRIIAGRR
ncbi:MAG: hypothetical protein U9Q69_06400 [Nanoarchaeota archaeon]|nr:hypothetical protein [Nanoarchaeota archaeon]